MPSNSWVTIHSPLSSQTNIIDSLPLTKHERYLQYLANSTKWVTQGAVSPTSLCLSRSNGSSKLCSETFPRPPLLSPLRLGTVWRVQLSTDPLQTALIASPCVNISSVPSLGPAPALPCCHVARCTCADYILFTIITLSQAVIIARLARGSWRWLDTVMFSITCCRPHPLSTMLCFPHTQHNK